MNSNTTQTPKTAAAEEQPAGFNPTEIFAQVRALRDQLQAQAPKILQQLSRGQRRRLAHLDDQFVLAAVSSASASDVLQKAIGRSDADLRNEMAEIALWTLLADEARGLLSEVLDALTARRARIGLATMQIQKIARQLARDPAQHPQIAPNLAEMKRVSPSKAKRKAAPAGQPVPAPTQPPVTKS